MSVYPDDPYNKRNRDSTRRVLNDIDWMFNPYQIEREPSTEQLRGCGDPDCTLCNPSIAERRARDGTAGRPYNGARSSEPSRRQSASRAEVEDYLIAAPEQAFSDIIGNEESLTLLRDAIEAPKRYAELYAAYGMKMPKGALLSGPPGCGKTMFARAAAYQMSQLYGMKEFICLGGADLQSMFVGETEARIKAIFAYAREYAHANGHPLLIFIDEAEVILPDRTGRVRRVAPWEESQVATFLAEMDGMQESGAFVLLATNRPETIDQAVLRDGRCDFKITVRRPTQEAIEVIVRNSFAGAPLAEPLDSLVFAAVESFYDPHKIILDFHMMVEQMKDWFESRGYKLEKGHKHLEILGSRNFSFEHIVSGAMAASVGLRAKRHAFSRDKASGTVSGINQADVIAAVNDLFEENRKLEHQFALQEFMEELDKELKEVKE